MNKTLEYYLALPYTIELAPDPDGGWFVAVKELPGCISQGDTEAEALDMIRDAMEGWLEVALEDGMKIPEPRNLEDYSGKFVVRVPRSLHRELTERAEEEGTSLNQYINVLLAHAIGDRVPTAPADDIFWPGLKQSARHALRCAGMEEEAGELDERLFADYAETTLAQVEAAIQGNYIRDASSYLERLDHILSLAEQRSPALSVFRRTAKMLQTQIERQVQLQQGLVEREMLMQAQIQQRVQKVSEPLLENMTRESRVRYSEASIEPVHTAVPVQISTITSTHAEW